MGRVLNPHDLLRLAPGTPDFANAPAWVAASLERAPFVVVRRAYDLEGRIAVGIRGAVRSERFGSWLDPVHIQEMLSPEFLRIKKPCLTRAALPAFRLLRTITPICDCSGYAWGPTGSTGFELASACPAVTETSDLDLVMRAPEPLGRSMAKTLCDTLSAAALEHKTRIDIQIETREGAFSLAEFARSGACVMLRSPDGPKLVADPWQTGRAA